MVKEKECELGQMELPAWHTGPGKEREGLPSRVSLRPNKKRTLGGTRRRRRIGKEAG